MDVALSRELVAFGGEDRDPRAAFELVEAFIWFKQLADGRLSVQVGRQQFKDDREWLYDEELDAVRVRYGIDRLDLEFSISRNGLVRKDLLADEHDGDRINNYHAYAGYQLTDRLDIGAYVLVRDDQSSAAHATHVAGPVRSHGMWRRVLPLFTLLVTLPSAGCVTMAAIMIWDTATDARSVLQQADDGRIATRIRLALLKADFKALDAVSVFSHRGHVVLVGVAPAGSALPRQVAAVAQGVEGIKPVNTYFVTARPHATTTSSWVWRSAPSSETRS